MADITKLKAKSDKGVPPPIETTNDNLKGPAGDKALKKAKIEFSVPEHVVNEFAQAAGTRFGFKKRIQVGFVYSHVVRVQKQDIRLAGYPASRISL